MVRRSATAERLGVWMNGERVGQWEAASEGHVFQYDPEWIAAPSARVLSLSLPFTPGNAPHRGAIVESYFDNLLPDSDGIRLRLHNRFGARSTAAFDLLTAIGRDCVGAVQLLAPDLEPSGFDRIDATPLNEAGVERMITAALSGAHVLGHRDTDDLRISIAGAQEKTALLRRGKRWYKPLGATPTTHILKLPMGLVGNMQADMRDSVENEWLCARLMNHLDLPTASCEIATFGARRVLVVERFDRALQRVSPRGEWIARLPQEDFCQALGVPSALKYEADGGPGMRAVLRLLDGSSNAAADKYRFVKAQVTFWLLAATDGHAKNFSLFHERGGTYRLTPFYDVISAWPIIGTGPNRIEWRKARLAMAVRSKNAHWKLAEIRPAHWDLIAKQAGVGDSRAIRQELADTIPAAITSVSAELPTDFPPRVADSIFAGMNAGRERLLSA